MKEAFLAIAILALTAAACKLAFKKANAAGTSTPDSNNDQLPSGALYPVAVKGKWGYINNRLEMQIAPQFSTAADFNEGLAAVSTQTGNEGKELYGYIDTAGRIIVDCQYNRVFPFYEGFAAVVKDGLYGYIDKNGKEVIPCRYEDGSRFSEGLACVKLDDRNGFIDTSGDMIIPPQFKRACWVSDFSEGMAAVYTGEDAEGGYINKKGEWVVPPVYSYVGSFSDGLALVRPKDGFKNGYINHKGEMVIEAIYDMGLAFHDGVAAVKLTEPGKAPSFIIIDKSGKRISQLLPYLFTGIFVEGMAGVENQDHLWGFVDKTGKEIIKPQYAGVTLFHNGLARMQTGSLFKGLKTVYINRQGKTVWKE